MKLLRDVEGDEISLVNRAANRRKFLLLKGENGVDNDIADILEVPWKSEGALLDEIRKDGIDDENVEKAVIAAVRLLKGVEDEFSPELVEKLGQALYPQKNPPLNSGSGTGNGGELIGSSDSEEDESPDGSGSGTDNPGSASGDSLEGSGSAPKVAADTSDDDADDQKGKKPPWLKRRSKTQKEDSASEEESVEKDANEGSVIDDEERGTVDTHAVPVQKEDGSWDFTDVPDASAAFFRAMIQKQDEQATELKAAKEAVAKSDDTLLSRQMVEKAARLSHVAATDDLAPVLKEASQKLDPETFEKLETILSAAQERVSKGDLFKEMGRTGLGSAENKQDAWSQIEKKADELVEKGEDISKEAAIDRVMRTDPQLYNQYLFENGMGVA